MANEETGLRLTPEQFDEFLRAVVESVGGVSALAKRSTVDKSNISKMVRGIKKPQPLLLRALKIREERVYILPEYWAEWFKQR